MSSVVEGTSEPGHGVSRRGGTLALVALCLSYAMLVMDATVVNTALPEIGRDLHTGVSGLQWVLDGYTVVFACLLLSAGSLGDRLGSRRVFLAGIVLFSLASLVCGLAPALGVLNGARVAQGAGAALALPTSLALIKASYPDRSARAWAIGIWGGIGGVGAGLGPVIGGVLTSALGWPAIFVVNVPVGLVVVLLTARFVVAPPPGERTGLDLPGQVLSILAVAGVAWGLIEGGSRGWSSPSVVAAFLVAAGAGTGFVLAERRSRHPMLPLELFGHRGFSGSVVVGAAINTGFYGQLFLMSLYFQHVRGLSPLLAGLALLPQPGIASIASALAGRHVARRGARRIMLVGLSVGAAGFVLLLVVSAVPSYWALVVPLLAIGFGTAYTMPAATAATMEAAPENQSGVASGALNASRQVGSTVGVAAFGTLIATTSTFVLGYQLSALAGAAVFATGALVVLAAVPAER